MYNPHGLQQYKHDDISSMPREKIVVLLYERLIEDLQDSISAVDSGDRVGMTKALNHASRIVSELRMALDHEVGGEIARNLDSLYSFVFSAILEQIVDRNAAHARDSIQVLAPLLESWRQIPAGTADRAQAGETGTEPAGTSEKEAASPHPTGPDPRFAGIDNPMGSLSVSA
ncbi:hypothetical protein COW53_03565 [bacterium CG17_big_fil_post_rev_8_21_14_2_50_64_8]|nr:MAG: hypothetical protein COW53_03565 [bacterium CG17_big_fil_post_rev_8_21_14_2_50_64_8]PJA77231.1 MAG: hypothetical protein CO151_00025 [bacterium CG_4_9_14_3_um_filter_65_15]